MRQMSPHPSRGRTWRMENMNLQRGEKRIFGKAILAAAVLFGMLAFAGTPRAYAYDDDRCQRRIAKADHKLHEAVEFVICLGDAPLASVVVISVGSRCITN